MKTAYERNPCFSLRRSKIQGRGAFATRPIRKGTRIIEYEGERVSNEEADRRYDDEAMGRHHTFLFSIDDDTSIDGNVNGNDSAFINHSCDPNCEAVAEDGRIFIHAIRAIPTGGELTYDYRYARQGTSDKEAREIYPCHCGSPNCRGTILAPREPKKKAKKKAAPKKKAAAKRGSNKVGTARKVSKVGKTTKVSKTSKTGKVAKTNRRAA